VTGLSEQELQVLALERQWWQRAGSKDAVVRDLFGWTATEYHRRLNLLIDRPEALEHDPVVVNRLRERRERGRLLRRQRIG
jgi:hypothetical protein